MKKHFTLGFLTAGFIFYLASCGTTQKIVIPTQSRMVTPPVVLPPVYKHDTVVIQPKKMTPKELQAYLLPFYKANYDNLFAPEFKRLGGTINILAADNERLTSLVLAMRTRSIVKNDSNLRVQQKKDSEILQLRRVAVDQNREIALQNKLQIFKINNITLILEITQGVMIFAIVVLGFFVYLLWKRIKYLSQSISYA